MYQMAVIDLFVVRTRLKEVDNLKYEWQRCHCLCLLCIPIIGLQAFASTSATGNVGIDFLEPVERPQATWGRRWLWRFRRQQLQGRDRGIPREDHVTIVVPSAPEDKVLANCHLPAATHGRTPAFSDWLPHLAACCVEQ